MRSGRLQGLFRQSLLACVRACALCHPVATEPHWLTRSRSPLHALLPCSLHAKNSSWLELKKSWTREFFHTTLFHSSREASAGPTAGKSSSLAGLFPLVYAYVVDCAPASPYAYSSSTHRFPDERTPIEATPLSATSAELGLGLDSLAHFSSHALPFFSPPSFHTLSLFPAFTSVWWSD